MTLETQNLLIVLMGVIAGGASSVLGYLAIRAYKSGAKFLNLPVDPKFVVTLENLATLAIDAVEQKALQWIKSQEAVGAAPVKMTGEEKKELAVKAMLSSAPPGMKILPEQADVAIEAAVYRSNSMRPPPPSPDQSNTLE